MSRKLLKATLWGPFLPHLGASGSEGLDGSSSYLVWLWEDLLFARALGGPCKERSPQSFTGFPLGGLRRAPTVPEQLQPVGGSSPCLGKQGSAVFFSSCASLLRGLSSPCHLLANKGGFTPHPS